MYAQRGRFGGLDTLEFLRHGLLNNPCLGLKFAGEPLRPAPGAVRMGNQHNVPARPAHDFVAVHAANMGLQPTGIQHQSADRWIG
jgi:hypothetical protein